MASRPDWREMLKAFFSEERGLGRNLDLLKEGRKGTGEAGTKGAPWGRMWTRGCENRGPWGRGFLLSCAVNLKLL